MQHKVQSKEINTYTIVTNRDYVTLRERLKNYTVEEGGKGQSIGTVEEGYKGRGRKRGEWGD